MRISVRTLLLLFFLAAHTWAQAESARPGAASAAMGTEVVGAGHYVQMLLGLFAVLAVIVALAWMMRRMGNFQSVASGALKVLAGLSLGQRERVVLLQVGETQILLGIAPGQIRTLHVLQTPLPTAGATQQKESFAARLKPLLKQRGQS